ncbi:VanZ family protein [Paenibacillus sp. FSL K6-1217]|uniref:VanZ family protein n=1 Tax=Paenibacillus sp. FSL K6-1217 TaxID=2921466 RepID=UPI0032460354
MGQSIMFTIQSPYVLVPLFVLFVLYLIADALLNNRMHSAGQYFTILTFSIYLLCVMHLVFFPIDVNIGKYANLIPWYKTINYLPLLTLDLTTFVLNIVMLVPLGMYLPLLHRKFKSLTKVVRYGFCVSLSIEVLQLIIRIVCGSARSTDINDLIANTAGAAVGYLLISRLFKWGDGKQWLNKLRL